MTSYECTRCDSFGTSGDPESQRCECDDIEDSLRLALTKAEADRDAMRHDRDVCGDELAQARAALRQAEHERDEARARFDEYKAAALRELHYDMKRIVTGTPEERRQRELDEVKAHRTTLLAEVERLKTAGAWKPSEVWREEVADEVAEQIAKYIDTEAYERREEGFSYRTVSELAASIRAHAWKKGIP